MSEMSEDMQDLVEEEEEQGEEEQEEEQEEEIAWYFSACTHV